MDFHFLKLYLAGNSYLAGAAFRYQDRSVVYQHENLYQAAEEAELKFESIMDDPPPMKRYLDNAVWKKSEFPLSDGNTLSVAVCFLGEGAKKELAALSAQLPEL